MAKVAPIDHIDQAGSQTVASTPSERSGIRPSSRGGRISTRPSTPADNTSTVVWTRWSGLPLPVFRPGRSEHPVVVALRRFLHSRAFTVLAMVALIIALFMRDIFVLCQVPTNVVLDVVLTCVFVLFALEFLGLTFTDTSYFLGFFFWMDLVGTLSMIFDISYMLGIDATQRVRVGDSAAGENFILVRAARAAKLGARAGRLSRVLKILRFLPLISMGESAKQMTRVKMAKVISNQLTNVLSTRVALQAITLVVVLPLFSIFSYPEVDDSMSVWAELLSRNVQAYRTADLAGNATATASALARLDAALRDCWNFYSGLNYAPWSACYGRSEGGSFVCEPNVVPFTYQFPLGKPERNASIWEVSHDNFQLFFDLSTPKQEEAAAAIGLVWFIITVMCIFGMVMSSSISVIALQPLERMLSVVRRRCGEIFKYTTDLEDRESQQDEIDALSDPDVDIDQVSEFMLLEKVVAKLAAIAHISSNNAEVEIKKDMDENELIMLNWMQGTQVRTDNGSTIVEVREAEPVKEAEDERDPNQIGFLASAGTRANLPREVLDTIATDDFDPLEFQKEIRIAVAAYIVASSQGSSTWVRANVSDSKLLKFMTAVEGKYKENPFHNFSHGLDVLHSIAVYFSQVNSEGFISDVTQFWMLIAAVAHDVGHLGINNQYLVETGHELALKYNDRAPMENMHCALLFKLAAEPEADIFSQVEKSLYKEMRKGVISVILHTDMAKHNDVVKELGVLYQMSSDAFDALSPGAVVSGSSAHLQLILNALVHCADVSNPTKPWDLCTKLAYLCLDEFFAQGDLERAAGIPVQMLNDRERVNKPNSQVGFIEFVITPLVEVIVSLFPQLDGHALRLGQNAQNWALVWQEEANPSPDAASKVQSRVQRVATRCEAVMRERRSPDLCTL